MKRLLLCVPIHWSDADPAWVCGTALGAILPLVAILGGVTQRRAGRLGATIGGLLNATLANAPELNLGLAGLTESLQPMAYHLPEDGGKLLITTPAPSSLP